MLDNLLKFLMLFFKFKDNCTIVESKLPFLALCFNIFGVIYLEMNFWSLVTHHKQLHVLYHFLFGSHEEILHLCDRCDSWSALLAVPFLIYNEHVVALRHWFVWQPSIFAWLHRSKQHFSTYFSHRRACTANFVANFELLFWCLIETVTLIYIFQALIYTSKLHTSLDKKCFHAVQSLSS